MKNYWHSKATERMGKEPNPPWVGPADAFEGYETLGERGLGNFEFGGCGTKVLVFRHGDEGAQLSKCRAILFIMHAYYSNTYL